MGVGHENRASLYAEVTGRVIAELEQGRLPWVQPWDAAACGCAMPANAVTGRRYSGINVLILWAAVIEGRYGSQRWLTFRQAQAAGGSVRRGERGTTICYADRFTPKDEADYIGSWLMVLREDEKAIFRAASAASKAADYLLGFVSDVEAGQ